MKKIKLSTSMIPLIIILLLLLIAAVGIAVVTATPVEPVVANLHPLPTSTPTVTPTPGWWGEVDYEATPALKKLPGVSKSKFKGGIGGEEPGKPLKIKPVSCPGNPLAVNICRDDPGHGSTVIVVLTIL